MQHALEYRLQAGQTVCTSFLVPRLRGVEPAATEDSQIRLKAVLRTEDLLSRLAKCSRSGLIVNLIPLKKSYFDLFTLVFGPENEGGFALFRGFSAES
jgi:hypothetical protein